VIRDVSKALYAGETNYCGGLVMARDARHVYYDCIDGYSHADAARCAAQLFFDLICGNWKL